jgi:hypothetical protein
MQAGKCEHGVALGKLLNGGRAQFVGLRHRAGYGVRRPQITAPQIRLAAVPTHLCNRGGNSGLHLVGRVVREGMAKILHDVEAVATGNHAQPYNVESRVEQVGTMWRREHQVLMSAFHVGIESDILSVLLKQQIAGSGQPVSQGGLAVKLMRDITRLKHGLSVPARRQRKAAIQNQGRGSRFGSRLIG